jgi:hypothetical protein
MEEIARGDSCLERRLKVELEIVVGGLDREEPLTLSY